MGKPLTFLAAALIHLWQQLLWDVTFKIQIKISKSKKSKKSLIHLWQQQLLWRELHFKDADERIKLSL